MKIGLSLAIVDPKGSGVIAALNEDFTNGAVSLDPLITFSRASSATYFDSAGVLQTAGSEVARAHAFQDYNPSTLAPLGFLIEEQRTNSIRNNTMVGAAAGTPGTLPTNWLRSASPTSGISSNIVAIGTESGIDYIDIRFSGTASATFGYSINFDSSTAVSASPSQSWTVAANVKLSAGALNGAACQYVISEYSSAPAFLRNSFSSTVTPTGAGLSSQRISFTATTGASAASVQPTIAVNFTNTLVYDFTLRIGLPQLELGAFATSVIKTTAAAATRLADSATITGTNFSNWYNQTAGTFIVSASSRQSTSGPSGAITVWDGTNNNRIYVSRAGNSSNCNVAVRTGGVAQASESFGSWPLSTSLKAGIAYAANDVIGVLAGTLSNNDTSVTLPTVDALVIGGDAVATTKLNGWISSLSYFRARLPNATLQSVTT